MAEDIMKKKIDEKPGSSDLVSSAKGV